MHSHFKTDILPQGSVPVDNIALEDKIFGPHQVVPLILLWIFLLVKAQRRVAQNFEIKPELDSGFSLLVRNVFLYNSKIET